MSSAQPLRAAAGLLPLPRPLMTGEVLDAAFRLKRSRFDGYWKLEMELLDVARGEQD